MITNHRQPQPRLAAVYLLMPTSLNVDLILRDYAPSAQPEPTGKSLKRQVAPQSPQEPPKYAAAYVNFMEGEAVPCSRAQGDKSRDSQLAYPVGINDALVGRLTDGLPENYLQGLKELYINFHGPSPLPLLDASLRCCTCSSRTFPQLSSRDCLRPAHPAPSSRSTLRRTGRPSTQWRGGRTTLAGPPAP